ncbi:MAG TPA: SigE family RNA polymerase sigma factor [Mycobacteriales bacterium]|nr:SigE family RNA polymerase sigma factor [Mycobacteriales bacterium]
MKSSEEAAYREYVTGRLGVLRRTAYLLCRDWHTADDLVSTTITKLYRHWGRAHRFEGLDGYTNQILVNAWRDELRRPWRREWATDTLPDVEAESAGPALVDERLSHLDLLSQLSPRRRAAVVLRFYCDLSIEQTATVLGCSAGTVKSLTARGLASLRELTSQTGERRS